MQISECMTQDVRIVSPQDTLRRAAEIMAEVDAGSLPVGDNDRLVGMITDRDIAIRGVGMGRDGQASVGEVMTREIKYCFADEETDEVLENMADLQLRRLPVLSRDKRLVGIISLGDLAQEEAKRTGRALGDIVQPSMLHSQHI